MIRAGAAWATPDGDRWIQRYLHALLYIDTNIYRRIVRHILLPKLGCMPKLLAHDKLLLQV